MAAIRLDSVTKKYDGVIAVDDLTLEIQDQEFYVLLGPTGAGKTTTLRCLSGLESAHEGRVFIDNKDVTDWSPANRDVAMVFQQYSLYPNYTVRENLSFPLKSRIRNITPDERNRRVEYVAKTLRIDHLLDRATDKLSGGEMQRVSIGRAIVREPQAFLMDEPLSNLDAKLREALRLELKRLQRELGATLLYVTHDQVEAMSMADRIGVIRDGVLIQSDKPFEVYNRPKNVFVAGFVGTPKINFLEGHVTDGNLTLKGTTDTFRLKTEVMDKIGNVSGEVIVGIRPEDVNLQQQQDENTCAAMIYLVEHMGMENWVSVRIGEHQQIRAVTDSAFEADVDATIYYSFEQEKLHFFDQNTEDSLVL
ncbi:MAG: ABC transporter ATP-binding protein [Arenicellales bacterium]|nr:ABC transporter ATP-binding protein [Arenicellales bacterium]